MATQNDMKRLEEKLDKVADVQAQINVTLASQAAQLGEHMRRTAIAEQRIEDLQKDVDSNKKSTYMVKGALWVLGGIVTLLGVVAAFWQAYKS